MRSIHCGAHLSFYVMVTGNLAVFLLVLSKVRGKIIYSFFASPLKFSV